MGKIDKHKFARDLLKYNGNKVKAYQVQAPGKSREAVAMGAERQAKGVIVKKDLREAVSGRGLTIDKAAGYLKEAIESGLGKKATNKDAIQGLKLLIDIWKEPDRVTENQERELLSEMRHSDLVEELKTLQKRLGVVLKGAQVEDAEVIDSTRGK